MKFEKIGLFLNQKRHLILHLTKLWETSPIFWAPKVSLFFGLATVIIYISLWKHFHWNRKNYSQVNLPNPPKSSCNLQSSIWQITNQISLSSSIYQVMHG